jgi:hypothetical protein
LQISHKLSLSSAILPSQKAQILVLLEKLCNKIPKRQ